MFLNITNTHITDNYAQQTTTHTHVLQISCTVLCCATGAPMGGLRTPYRAFQQLSCMFQHCTSPPLTSLICYVTTHFLYAAKDRRSAAFPAPRPAGEKEGSAHPRNSAYSLAEVSQGSRKSSTMPMGRHGSVTGAGRKYDSPGRERRAASPLLLSTYNEEPRSIIAHDTEDGYAVVSHAPNSAKNTII